MFTKDAASPLDAQHAQLLQLNAGALAAAAGVAAALAAAARGAWSRVDPAVAGTWHGTATGSTPASAWGCCRLAARCPGARSTPADPRACATDLLRMALTAQGLANVALFAGARRIIPALFWPLELAVNSATALLPGLDLLARGYDLAVRRQDARGGCGGR